MALNKKKRLILIALNEINLDVARQYIDSLELRNFQALFASSELIRTQSEERYEQLEPWIQWVSVHTGLTAAEHGIFRLGDIVGSKLPQIFEQVEALGHRVGCMSAMNAENCLRQAAYFIPDPWTKTQVSGGWWQKQLASAVAQAVNDNAQSRITARSLAVLAFSLVRFGRLGNYPIYMKLASASRGASWRKALFLDLFLHDLHMHLFRKHQPEFSTVFLNAGAHIQHHYFFNAKYGTEKPLHNPQWYVDGSADPIADMLKVYDRLLGDYLKMVDVDLIVATGLTQRPYDHVKFYYRLKDHRSFFQELGVPFSNVLPRMTRDVLIEFATERDALEGERILGAVISLADDLPVFGEIDNRGKSLFVTLTYPHEITPGFLVKTDTGMIDLSTWVAFVAIKNGMHHGVGYAAFRGAISDFAPEDGCHVSRLHGAMLDYFKQPV